MRLGWTHSGCNVQGKMPRPQHRSPESSRCFSATTIAAGLQDHRYSMQIHGENFCVQIEVQFLGDPVHVFFQRAGAHEAQTFELLVGDSLHVEVDHRK